MREVGFDQIRPKRTSTLREGWRRHAEGEEEHVRQSHKQRRKRTTETDLDVPEDRDHNCAETSEEGRATAET